MKLPVNLGDRLDLLEFMFTEKNEYSDENKHFINGFIVGALVDVTGEITHDASRQIVEKFYASR